jgi:hypothetical protein
MGFAENVGGCCVRYDDVRACVCALARLGKEKARVRESNANSTY